MDKRDITYFLVAVTKVASLAYIVLPVVLYIVSYIFWLTHNAEPDSDTVILTEIGLAILLGFTTGRWIMGHRSAVDQYYDEQEKDKS